MSWGNPSIRFSSRWIWYALPLFWSVAFKYCKPISNFTRALISLGTSKLSYRNDVCDISKLWNSLRRTPLSLSAAIASHAAARYEDVLSPKWGRISSTAIVSNFSSRKTMISFAELLSAGLHRMRCIERDGRLHRKLSEFTSTIQLIRVEQAAHMHTRLLCLPYNASFVPHWKVSLKWPVDDVKVQVRP